MHTFAIHSEISRLRLKFNFWQFFIAEPGGLPCVDSSIDSELTSTLTVELRKERGRGGAMWVRVSSEMEGIHEETIGNGVLRTFPSCLCDKVYGSSDDAPLRQVTEVLRH